ncbi:LysR family transcriptional regulator [Actinomycetospora sp. NBRC 106375]|uniref:LysR family transcriptional regulator n=1 Tax=Actinomycetospora sp. NBRC 106375 TaxID=3032207 RepID=UPI0024A42D35|nr:LysR family transcriptional regulator [Actinomycetospora sp. NBRC 106375]GLZ47010.1 LysR family transcriptional regulator [Actinomycetospora sp. NBRC 106375]
MSSPEYSLRQLGYFVAVAEAGTLAGASATLHVSASALSLALDELERALGVQLTVRRRAHGIRLTPAGQDTLRRARRLLRDAGELADAAGGEAGDVAGAVRVGCYTTLAPGLLPATLGRFAARHPRARVEFVEGPQDQLQRGLLEGELDVAVLYDHRLDPALELTPLSSNTPYLVLPAGHPLARDGGPVKLADLVDEPMVLLDLPPSSEHALGVCLAAGLSPRVRHRTANPDTARALVGQGLGFTVLAQAVPGTRTHAGDEIVAVPIADDPAPLPIVLAWSGQVAPTATARAFAAAARDSSGRHHR